MKLNTKIEVRKIITFDFDEYKMPKWIHHCQKLADNINVVFREENIPCKLTSY